MHACSLCNQTVDVCHLCTVLTYGSNKSLQIYPLTSLYLEHTLIVHSALGLDTVFAELKGVLDILIKWNSRMSYTRPGYTKYLRA